MREITANIKLIIKVDKEMTKDNTKINRTLIETMDA
jgi:hypothetical protein